MGRVYRIGYLRKIPSRWRTVTLICGAWPSKPLKEIRDTHEKARQLVAQGNPVLLFACPIKAKKE